jgi:hypothetical protein
MFDKFYYNGNFEKAKADAMAESKTEYIWLLHDAVDYTNFDFTFVPNRFEADQAHAWPSHNNLSCYTTWLLPINIKEYEINFHSELLPNKLTTPDVLGWHWEIDNRIDYSTFDFNWLPDIWDHDKVHAFCMSGTTQLAYTFLKPNKATGEIKYHESTLKFKDEIPKSFENNANDWEWIIDERIDYTNFDFSWLPEPWDADKRHSFCMANTEQLAYTHLVNRSRTSDKVKYHASNLLFKTETTKLIEHNDDQWIWQLDARVDYSNFNFAWLPEPWDHDKQHCFVMKGYRQLSYTKLLNKKYPVCENKFHKSNLTFKSAIQGRLEWPDFVTETLQGKDWQDSMCNWALDLDIADGWMWIVDPRIDYTGFNFDWLPELWDDGFIHCFAMKGFEKLSYTWLVNFKTIKEKKYKYHTSNLKFKERPSDIVLLDMNNDTIADIIARKHDIKKKLRFTGNMIDVVTSAIKRCDKEWLWVVSSCTSYDDFNFKWLPDLDQTEFAHCWPCQHHIKGDTFLIHIPTYLRTNKLEFNFEHKPTYRYPWPAVEYECDNLVEALNTIPRSSSLYTIYYKKFSKINKMHEPSLWEDRLVVGFNTCNSVSLVPRDCIVKEELYEYEFLEKHTDLAEPIGLDVIFIHNGEKDAKHNMGICNSHLPPGMHLEISSGVNGRLKAYKQAAELSNTDWFLAVFAKCLMKESFRNFTWRPDYWQKPKHYIFHNHNVDLNLTYGHMAPIAYNKKLMLANTGGLDMTLVQEHAVVPMVISETRLIDPWDTWRTSFRETIKLMYYARTDDSLELQYRLNVWMNAEQMWAKHNPWYQYGAKDARDYFESINGDLNWVLLTSEWDWLRQHFNRLYPTQSS